MKEIKKPAFMQEAAANPGHPWILELLICMGIYLVGLIVSGFGQVPALMAYLLQNHEYVQMVRTGEMDMELITRLMKNPPEWYFIFVLFTEVFMIFAYMIYCRFVEKRKISTMGFVGKGAFGQYMKGLVIGTAAFCTAYLICLVTGSIRFEGAALNVVPAYILLYFGGYMMQGMAEEVICRGFLLVSLSRRYSIWFSAVMSSLLFMSLHFANDGMTWLSMANLFLFGMFMALLFLESGNIWVVGAVHTVWNFLQGNVFGVQVSGLAKQNSVFNTMFVDGYDAIHGGSFGMEGGLAVTFILIVGIRLVYFRMKKKDLLSEITPDENRELMSLRPDVEQEEANQILTDKVPEKPSFQEVFSKQETGPVPTMFNADYFRIKSDQSETLEKTDSDRIDYEEKK